MKFKSSLRGTLVFKETWYVQAKFLIWRNS